MRNNILIVTPTLGTRDSLAQTIESVRAVPEVRHVITCPAGRVDAIRKRFGGELDIVCERRTEGVYAAVNDVLLSAASEIEWVTYINDDDYWLSGVRELVLRARTSKSDLLYGRVNFVDREGGFLATSSTTRFYKLFPHLAARGIYPFTQQAVILRSRAFKQFKGFDERYKIQGDNDLWIRMIRGGVKCEFVNEVCAAYRMHDAQLSASSVGLVERKEMLGRHGLAPDAILSKLAMITYRFLNCRRLALRYLRGGRSIKRSAGR